MIKVVIALEEPLLRLGAKAALDEAEDCTVVGMVDRREAVEEEVRRTMPQVLVMDVEFQKEDRQIILRLVEEDPELKVLVFVEHSDEECSIRALLADPEAVRFSVEALEHLDECCLTSLRSSARGCVPRTSEPGHLLQAVRTVAAGEIAASPWLTAILNPGGSGVRPDAPGPISARELDVIGLVAEGKGNKEIAKILGIREQTVKNHLASIMQKLGAKSRLEVGIHAVRQNLTSSEGSAT
jgi:DNA-binding NarL/FixJ family response regulator